MSAVEPPIAAFLAIHDVVREGVTIEISRLFDENFLVVLLACQMHIEANTTWVSRHGLNNMPPQHVQVRRVAENVKFTPSSRQSNADTSLDLWKINVAANVTSDKRTQYNLVLLTLIRVYGDNVEFAQCRYWCSVVFS